MCEFNHTDALVEHFGTNTSLVAELSAYLRPPKFVPVTDDHDFECLQHLDKSSLIQEIYLKYNCIFPTEADIERVFSYAGRISIHNFLCCFFSLGLVCIGPVLVENQTKKNLNIK